MSNHDEKGRFTKGNKARKKQDPYIKEVQNETKLNLAKAVASLSLPYKTLQADLEKDGTRLEYLTAHAISSRNYKFIQWLIEMVVGKPKQENSHTVSGEELSLEGLILAAIEQRKE